VHIAAISRLSSGLSFFFSRCTGLSKKLQLHLFFPSWKFFETEGPTLDFCFRTSVDAITFDEWEQNKPQLQKLRPFKAFFFNPDENYYLATCSLVEKLIIEINEIELNVSVVENEIRKLVTYHLVAGLANSMVISKYKNHNNNTDKAPKYFQFKVRTLDFNKIETESEGSTDIFISDIHELNFEF
jgi:hypothetical protein